MVFFYKASFFSFQKTQIFIYSILTHHQVVISSTNLTPLFLNFELALFLIGKKYSNLKNSSASNMALDLSLLLQQPS